MIDMESLRAQTVYAISKEMAWSKPDALGCTRGVSPMATATFRVSRCPSGDWQIFHAQMSLARGFPDAESAKAYAAVALLVALLIPREEGIKT